MSTRRYLLAGLFVACRAPDAQPGATPLPRFVGSLEPREAQWVTEMNYDPADAPVLWRHQDTLLVAHLERYSSYDVMGATCDGSGLFAVPVAPGIARAVATGRPVCSAFDGDGLSVDRTGQRMVFSTRTEPNNSVLARLDLASGRIDTLPTHCSVYAEEPAWSPDGHSIAFKGLCESRDQEDWAIYIVDADGRTLRAIPGEAGYGAESPSWSPDARRLAYVRTRMIGNAHSAELAVVDTLGKGRRVLTRGYGPAWSPDGTWIAYIAERRGGDRDSEVRMIQADGSGDRLLFRNGERTTYRRGWGPIREGLPAPPLVWSPDGEWLAFRRAFDRGASVWRVSVRTGEVRQVTRRER